jgi:hypothetical protein
MSAPANPRDEAERLVAAALGGLSVAIQATRGFATGSAECCVCPVCRAIAALRDPSPQFAERLATGAGDLATGLAGVLRAFAGAAGGVSTTKPPGPYGSSGATAPGGAPGETAADSSAAGDPGDPGDVWSAATRAPGQSEPAAPPQSPSTTPMAKKAVKPMAKKAVKPMAKKAIAPKKATPPAASPPESAQGAQGAAGQ